MFNLARVAELVLAVTTKDRSLLASAVQDRLHQPDRSRAYPYLSDTIDAACDAGALGAALSGAGGSVIAIADRSLARIGSAMIEATNAHKIAGKVATLSPASDGAVTIAG